MAANQKAQQADSARTSNLLGALAVALTDGIYADAEVQVAVGGQAPAALVSIGHSPGCSIDFLSKALKLSHPGTVRMVNSLEAEGLIERRAAVDGRAVALHLTEAGSRRRRKLLAGRHALLDEAISSLKPQQQEQLSTIVEQLLKVVRGPDLMQGFVICRLCDDRVCSNCPMGS